MKVSQNWLSELVDINTTPEELSEKLSIGGFEVESVEDCSSILKGVVLGKVLSTNKHQNSDKLTICKVDIGEEILQIICGANNIRSNIYVYVATVGTKINKLDLTIRSSEIRGVLSQGMICSLEELGLEAKSTGIAIVDNSLCENFKLGSPISDLLDLNDFIYDLAITANRPDGMSMIGIAREVSALLETNLSFPEVKKDLTLDVLKDDNISNEAISKDCIYSISLIENVCGKILSPTWLKDRLEKSDIKSINLIVDLTNYVLIEQGQPLHAFDKDKLNNIIGREVYPHDFGVRKANKGENILALDMKTYELNENITVITCANKPVAIAGIIGGLESSVSDTTSSVYLEAAVFKPSIIRKSSKELGIRTESSSRFEKGISNRNTIHAIGRTLYLINKFFEKSNSKIYVSNQTQEENTIIKLRRNRIHNILGPIVHKTIVDKKEIINKRNLNDNEIIDKLKLIGCSLKSTDFGWEVNVLPNRSIDLRREIDLIEEIARLIGYDLFDEIIPNPLIPGKLSSHQTAIRNLKNSFIYAGFNEVLTYSLVSNDDPNRVKISNPLFSETSCLRNNIWEDHLKIVNQNIKAGRNNCWIFEIGKIFSNSKEHKEVEYITGAICGINRFEYWNDSEKIKDLDYFHARGKLREVLNSLNISIVDSEINNIDFLHPGMSSILSVEGKEVGFFGQIHPKLISEKIALKEYYLFSIKLKEIIEASTRKNKLIPIFKNYPTVPKIERDINFLFNKKYTISKILSVIKKSGRKLLEEISLVDIYSDKKIGDDYISYTFRLSYRDKLKTLKDSEITEIHSEIIRNIEHEFSTKLRE